MFGYSKRKGLNEEEAQLKFLNWFGLKRKRFTVNDPVLFSLNAGLCPSCGGNEFLNGPRGGMSQNIECASCGENYNVTPDDGPPFFSIDLIGWNKSGRWAERGKRAS